MCSLSRGNGGGEHTGLGVSFLENLRHLSLTQLEQGPGSPAQPPSLGFHLSFSAFLSCFLLQPGLLSYLPCRQPFLP
jgi:hypothetical protein